MKKKIIYPFQRLNDLALDLSQGHFKGDILEKKSRYLGRFMWGISQLKDKLDISHKYGDGMRIDISFYEENYCQLVHFFNTREAVCDNEFNHIFESFFRGSNSQGLKGNGSGLYICREYMRKMDGDIFAEKTKEGMAFILVFR